MKTVVISVCSFRRPQGLTDLLLSLKSLVRPEGLEISVRVIDNDQVPSARDLVHGFVEGFPVPLSYVHEAEPGLTSARNRALSEALHQDYLAFVDDDETVDPTWLAELWRVHQESSAQFTQGPVVYGVVEPRDTWWVEGGFFRQNMFEDGAEISEAWTNNVLIDMSFVRAHNLQFDMAVRYIGGEDTLFFQDMVRVGAKGAFAAQAIVYEMQPQERLSWGWGVSRHYRYGVTRALCLLLRQSKPRAVCLGLVRATGMMGVGLLKLPLALFRGKRGVADSLAYMARSVGVLAGLAGRRYNAYER